MIGLMALMLLAAIAVPVYFRRVRHEEGPWRTLIAPVTAAVLLAVAICLVVSKVALFTMASTTVNTLLVALVPAVFLTGLALAQRLKTRRPEVYARFAEETATEAPQGAEPCPLPTPSSPEPASAPSTPPAPRPAR